MSARALYSISNSGAVSGDEAREPHVAEDYVSEDYVSNDYVSDELFSGERVCAPRDRAGGNTMLSATVVIVMALGGIWALSKANALWPGWSHDLAGLASALSHRDSAPADPSATAQPAAEPPALARQPAGVRDVADAPGVSAGTPMPETAAVAAPSEPVETAEPDETANTPLPPPVIDPADPYQKRAAAVGLHPDLSRALLKRMSDTDYRNAGIAIKTALADTTGTEAFVYPPEPKAKLARFEVHFVPGAASTCRRYVVTVTKDRWSTTARPMEKCGFKTAARSAGGTKTE